MIEYPNIDPIAFTIPTPFDVGFPVRWYGLTYLIAFGTAYFLATRRAGRKEFGFSRDQLMDMLFYCALGVILGGRIGYVLFYNFTGFLDNPFVLFKVWQGGMSFHGGLLGYIFACYLYSRSINRSVWTLWDFSAPIAPLGLGAVRIGNFIGGELYGRVTDVPWAMIFPYSDQLPRHPSQLYQAFLEGLVLFVIIWVFTSKPRPAKSASGLFLLCYGVFRFVIEFVREPDAHIGFLVGGWLTMGQLLTLPMIIIGLALIVWAYRFDGSAPVKTTKA